MKAFLIKIAHGLASGVFWLLLTALLGAGFIIGGVHVLLGIGAAYITTGVFFFLLALFLYKGLTNGA